MIGIFIHKKKYQEKRYSKNNEEKTKAQPKRVVFYVHRLGLTIKLKYYNEFNNPGSTKPCFKEEKYIHKHFLLR
jgi:hypothetical protein